MTRSEYYTYQFYAWEFRGRGWYIAPLPLLLEAPYMPFFRHGYNTGPIDDGKRHSWFSWLASQVSPQQVDVPQTHNGLDYESLDPYVFEGEYELHVLRVSIPKQRKGTTEQMKILLTMVSQSVLPISFEIIGTHSSITVQFVGSDYSLDCIETYMRAFFPTYGITRGIDALESLRDNSATAVTDYGLQQEFFRPLSIGKGGGIDPLMGIFAVLDRLGEEEIAGIQILFQPTVNHWSESILHSVTLSDGSSFFADMPDAPMLAREKVRSPLYGVSIRSFAQSEELSDAFRLIEKLSHGIIIGTQSVSNELIPMAHEAYSFESRIQDILRRESHRLGMLLNLDELVGLVHFPSDQIPSTKLYTQTRTTKPLPFIAKGKPYTIGTNTHEGVTEQVTVGLEERLKHMHIIGATGTGKSTLIAQLISQDIAKGHAVVVFDPHGHLMDDIIAAIPKERLKDVVLIDPSDIEHPIGLNILEAHSDIEKEVLSSDLVAAFRKYATSWGDQMNAVLGNAILALLESAEGGSLHDLRRFLLEKEFRSKILSTVKDHSIRYYWLKEYPLLKSNSVGSILTRLDSFLRPKSIRNMVVQKRGLDIEKLLQQKKIILCKLSHGLMGKENSYLLGSVLLSKLHQAIFRRQEQSSRTPVFIYLDEFQHFITPSIADMLSGIRKYQAGLILSHQDLQQLQRGDGELLNSVLSNTTTRVVFRVGEQDARKLQEGFSGFDQADLQNLGIGEAIIRIEQPQYDCSMDTIAPVLIEETIRQEHIYFVQEYCRKEYATTKAEVEQMLAETLDEEDQPVKHKDKQQQSPENLQQKEVIEEKPVAKTSTIKPTKATQNKPDIPNEEPEQQSTHRYLQVLVKKMAEARGYVSTIEAQLPEGTGMVDVLLVKDTISIAVEISSTTDPSWEAHNIQKCLMANFSTVVSLCGDLRHLEKIKKMCKVEIPDLKEGRVLFFTPDALFAYLDQQIAAETPQEQTVIKGYRVNVSYDAISKDEMERKRASVAKVIMDSLRKSRFKK